MNDIYREVLVEIRCLIDQTDGPPEEERELTREQLNVLVASIYQLVDYALEPETPETTESPSVT